MRYGGQLVSCSSGGFYFSKIWSVNRWIQFQKRSQQLIRMNNVTLSIVAMGINNPHRSAFAIYC